MKLVDHFTDFLTDVVDLNATRVSQLEGSIEALKNFIRESDWEPAIKSFVPQGSWAHKTIIRPIEGAAFDADLLVLVKPVTGWDAREFLRTLRNIFANDPTYEDKINRFSHCVTVEYAAERKIDIAPCVVDRGGGSSLEVCNHSTNSFEASEPLKYTDWLIERNGWTGGNGLRKVTRLTKYLRDIKTTFTCPSVLLTTLLGARITSADAYDNACFEDLRTALKTIVGRLDDWLQVNSTRPSVSNPVLSSEILSDLWDDDQYTNFRDKINTYRGWIDDAFAESDRDESIGKWRRVFGDDFAKSVAIEKAALVSSDALTKSLAEQMGVRGDLVTLFSRFGRSALPPDFDRLPHKERPRWRPIPNLLGANVMATLHDLRDGPPTDKIGSGEGPLPKDKWLHFRALTPAGMPFSNDFKIYWRVTNTDQDARRANCLRGKIEEPNDGMMRWESLQYRGVHSVEAFVVRRRDQRLIAQSEPFYVVIQ